MDSFAEFHRATIGKAQAKSDETNSSFLTYIREREIPFKLIKSYPPCLQINRRWMDFFLQEKLQELGLFWEYLDTTFVVYLDQPYTSWS